MELISKLIYTDYLFFFFYEFLNQWMEKLV